MDRQAAGHGAADIVVMAEHLAEADQPALVEDRDGGAEVGHMPDAAGAVVGIVPEEDIAFVDVVRAEIVEHRLHQGGVGAPGELAAPGIEEGDAVVVLVADHGRARGALDRRLDLELRRADGAGNDLELDRPQGRRRVPLRHPTFSITRVPKRSQATRQAAGTTTVEPYSSTMSGPSSGAPGAIASRCQIGQSIQPLPRQ